MTANLDRLLDIMARLRDPERGCPWDVEQSFATIAPYTIEEAYEVADAIDRGDLTELREELGDLLLQVVFHAQMASETGHFSFDDVAGAIADKLVRRHPHVFGDATAADAGAVRGSWEHFKANERHDKAAAERRSPGVLDNVPLALPALSRAEKLQRRAARVGFDWPEVKQVVAKIAEELREVEREIDGARSPEHLAGEIGDLLFAVANLARHLGIEPEEALRRTNHKFTRRFGYIEDRLHAEGRHPEDAGLDEMERLWQESKSDET
ncbi:MAG: nucleoside triphosphate pyrophosphohydrolase [Alphaproteobacteria bacterium]